MASYADRRRAYKLAERLGYMVTPAFGRKGWMILSDSDPRPVYIETILEVERVLGIVAERRAAHGRASHNPI